MRKLKPTPDLTKLPKWAQEHIDYLQRQRDQAVKTLREFTDNQTPGPLSYQELVCIEKGAPVSHTRYIQSNDVTFEYGNVRLNVRVPPAGSDKWHHLTLQWESIDRRHGMSRSPGLVPLSYCRAQIEPAVPL